jgi:hypothetical protein
MFALKMFTDSIQQSQRPMLETSGILVSVVLSAMGCSDNYKAALHCDSAAA